MNQNVNLKFAKKILASCGLDENAAYLANLPVFIAQGPFHGSMFTHALTNLPDMLEVIEEIFSSMEKMGQNPEETRQALDGTIKSTQQSMQNSNNFMEYFCFSLLTLNCYF